MDLDSNQDPVHGQQEFSFYHGYFKRHICHPVLVFDAATGNVDSLFFGLSRARYLFPVFHRISRPP